MLKNKKIGFLGGGNMADAIIKGLISASFIEVKNICVSDIDLSRLEQLREAYKVKITQDNREVVSASDIVIFAVKPQVIQKVLNEVRNLIDDSVLCVSVVAGVPICAMEAILFGDIQCVWGRCVVELCYLLLISGP